MKRSREDKSIDPLIGRVRRWTIEPPRRDGVAVNPSIANVKWFLDTNRAWLTMEQYNPNILDATLTFEPTCLAYSFLSMVKFRSIVAADLDSMTDAELARLLSYTIEPLVDSYSLVELLLASGRHTVLSQLIDRSTVSRFINTRHNRILHACLCSRHPVDAFEAVLCIQPSFSFHDIDTLCDFLILWAHERLVFLYKQIQQVCAMNDLCLTTRQFKSRMAMYSVVVETFARSILPLFDMILDRMLPRDSVNSAVTKLWQNWHRMARNLRLQGGIGSSMLLYLLKRLNYPLPWIQDALSLTAPLIHYNDTTRTLLRLLYPTRISQSQHVDSIFEALLLANNDQLFDEYYFNLEQSIDFYTFSPLIQPLIRRQDLARWRLLLQADTRIQHTQVDDSLHIEITDHSLPELLQATIESFRPDLVHLIQYVTRLVSSSSLTRLVELSHVVRRSNLLVLLK